MALATVPSKSCRRDKVIFIRFVRRRMDRREPDSPLRLLYS
jgi:hypothetical protein